METQHKDSAMAMSELTAAQLESATENSPPLGLYLHVPFCASTCDFCAFYQVRPDAQKIAGYLAGLSEEIALVAWDHPISTIFWGGGTPGLLSPDQLKRLGALMHGVMRGEAVSEWSVELAPASVTEARLAALKEIGVNRISVGVQSLRPQLLDGLGRQHSREQALRAYELVRSAGFESVNLDLMFALPGQSEEEWLADLDEALALRPDHLSTYCLTFEEDTALWVKLSLGKVKLDPVREAALYESTWARMAEAGFQHYEVSNFARPGHACRHNLNTWHMHEWVGLGPSAASQHRGARGSNIADLAVWREHLSRGNRMTEDRTVLTDALLLEDALIFGLRMNAGVDWADLRRRFGPPGSSAPVSGWPAIDELMVRLEADGLAAAVGSRLALTQRGRLLADAVAGEVMTAFERDASLSR